jgi:ABC-type multidrug transport system ATPase subunit/peptidoglycan/LPS O-acetylase OafA/YrhL
MTSTTERLHALDSVRGFALLAGIVLHAAMNFLPGFGAMGWPLADPTPSTTLAVTFFVIHVFRMTMFFMIAGFFAHLLYHRRGPRAFARNRATRILIPLVVGWIVVMPLIIAAFAWAGPAVAVDAPAPPAPAALAFPLTHLWFLYVLVLLYTGTFLVYPIVNRIDAGGRARQAIDRLVQSLCNAYVAPVVLAVPVFIAFVTDAEWRRWFGIMTPDQSLIPNPTAATAFITAFAFGWIVERRHDVLRSWQRQWAFHLPVAMAATIACLWLIGPAPAFTAAPRDTTTTIYAALYAVASWSWTFAIVGMALGFLSAESQVRRYVSDASYWIYILHLPLIFLLQAAVMRQPWHWSIKFTLIVTAVTALLFASYHLLVRPTFIGEVLNGARHPRRRSTGGTPPTDIAPAFRRGIPDGGGGIPGACAELSAVRKRYGQTLALDGVDLAVRPGELLAVLGPNGAGKSTAISLMLGLLDPDEGSARLFGRSPHDVEARGGVGVMMQEASLVQELRVREIVELATAYYPNPLTVDEALALTNTTALADRPYAKLSAGQKRQAQFAVAVCGRPSMLFLDEPTVGLDVQAREAMWAALRRLIAGGMSIVLTTHYLEEAEALADRVIVLNKGRVIASGSVDEMRALVDRKSIRCVTAVPIAELAGWPNIASATADGDRVVIVTTDADAVVRRILALDASARELEVQRAGLAEAFTALTQEAA